MDDTRWLAIRFDIESTTCLERGVPRLLELGRRYGVRFSFFANMGRSFNLWVNLRSRWTGTGGSAESRSTKLPLKRKLGWDGILKTVFWNPALGRSFLGTLERILYEGHELGLHGGMDHARWQHSISRMDRDEVAGLLRPAYRQFEKAFGAPQGFSSPGFRFNTHVLDVLDELGLEYSSDMDGETPFPTRFNGKNHRLWQVPVNVIGGSHVPLIEESLAGNMGGGDICRRVVAEITGRRFAFLYGHPYVEGMHWEILGKTIEAICGDYRIVTVSEYLHRWRSRNDRVHD